MSVLVPVIRAIVLVCWLLSPLILAVSALFPLNERPRPIRSLLIGAVLLVNWALFVAFVITSQTPYGGYYHTSRSTDFLLLLSFLGLLTSIWADKFDHAAAVTNFVVMPLSLLSGTFYSVHQLAPAFQKVSHANPFFYAISGFRAGFLGVSDSPLWIGAIGLLALNLILWAICYCVLKSGWKIKA